MSVNEEFWSQLLDKMENGSVIPVIGHSIIEVQNETETVLLDTLLAQKVAEKFKLKLSNRTHTLFDVVALVHKKDPFENLHETIRYFLKSILKEYQPAESLQKLAAITDFKLYVTLGFDSYLLQSIAENRSLDIKDIFNPSFSPANQDNDLKAAYEETTFPLVYSLFGTSQSTSEFVISEEEILEWIPALLDTNNRPQKLFDALHNCYILFIGCDLPDWLQRFFIRVMRKDRLLSIPQPIEAIVDVNTKRSGHLVTFLQRYSPKTETTSMVPQEFIKKLHEHWTIAMKTRDDDSQISPIPAGNVFLNYTSNDKIIAKKIYQKLQDNHTDVWFDEERLFCSDKFESVINKNIDRCGVFLIVLSATTLERLKQWHDNESSNHFKMPYFYKEWDSAIKRKDTYPDSFEIMTITIDEIDYKDLKFPEEVFKKTIGFYNNGEIDGRFISKVKENVRLARKYREKGKSK